MRCSHALEAPRENGSHPVVSVLLFLALPTFSLSQRFQRLGQWFVANGSSL
jgi:hypothetical protein